MESECSKNKKIIYFLMACNDEQTVKALKYSFLIQENKKISTVFIKKSKSAFKRNKKHITVLESDFFSQWKYFCKAANYEEVLLVILYGILKYPKEKLSWSLGISLETISYRVNQGLYLLGKKLLNKPSKEKDFQRQNDKKREDQIKEKALIYCQELAQWHLPLEFEKIKVSKKHKEIKYLLWATLCLVVFSFIIWLFSLIFSYPKTMILYESFLGKYSIMICLVKNVILVTLSGVVISH